MLLASPLTALWLSVCASPHYAPTMRSIPPRLIQVFIRRIVHHLLHIWLLWLCQVKSRISGLLESPHGLLYLHRVWDSTSLWLFYLFHWSVSFSILVLLNLLQVCTLYVATMLEKDSLQRCYISSKWFMAAITKFSFLSTTQMSCQYVSEFIISKITNSLFERTPANILFRSWTTSKTVNLDLTWLLGFRFFFFLLLP